MKKNTCLIKPQINALQREYGIEDLSFLSNLEDISKLNDVLNASKALDKLKKNTEDYNKFIKSVKDAAAFRTKNFTLLLTGTKPEDKLKGYTWSALNPIAQTVNSGIISLFNIVNLQKLTEKDRRKNIIELDNFFTDFLVDEEGEPTIERNLLDQLRFKFRNNKEPYGNLNTPETFDFYIREVIPFVELFLRKYYTNYFNPVIFTPLREKIEEENPGKTITELTKMSRDFAEQSANKDMLVGTIIGLRTISEQVAKLKELEGEAFKEKVEALEGYELIEKILDSFSLKDPAFSSLLSSTEGENEDDEETQATDENATRGFEVRGDEKSGFEAASNDTRSVLASLFNFQDNKLDVDNFGLPVLIDSFIAYKQLSLLTRGIFDYTEFYEQLKKNAKKYPYIQQLLDNHLPNPKDEATVERFVKLKPLERNRKERIKQSLLQDLSKDQVIAKEINLEAKRNKVNQEIQTLNINNAKLKSASLVYNDSVARFVQNYVLLRDRYFNMPMVTKQGYIRLSSFYKAYTIYQKISPAFSDASLLKKIPISDIEAVLAVLGIVPSQKLNSKTNSSELYTLITDYKTNIDSFFNKFKFNTDFGKVANRVQIKTGSINTIIGNSKDIAMDTSIEIPKAVSQIVNKFKVETDSSNKLITNFSIEYLVERYVDAVREPRANVNGLTKQFKESIIDAFDVIMSEKMIEEVDEKFVELITKVNNPISQLDDSKTGLGDIFRQYAELEYKLDTQYQDDMIIDYRGKPRSQIQMTNNLILKTNDLNSTTGSRQIFNRFPEFDPTLNVLMRSSLIFNQLYDVDDFGNATRNRSQSKLEVNSIQGVKLKSTYINGVSSGITDLNLEDNIVNSFYSLLMNGNEESYNVGKSAIYNIRFSSFERQKYLGKENKKSTSTTDKFLPIPVDVISKMYTSTFKKYVDSTGKQKKIRTLGISEKALDAFTPIANIFANYLTSYLLLFYEIEKGGLTYAKNNYENLSKNYAELSLFDKDDSKTNDNDFIITKELKDKFKEAVLNLEFGANTTQAEKMSEILNIIVKDQNDFLEFKDGLLGYFQNQVDTLFNNISYAKNYKELRNLIKLLDKKDGNNKSIFPYIPSFRVNTVVAKDLEPGDADARFKDTDLFKALLMTYAINYTVLNHEKMLLFFGDPMFVKDYAKRANAASSTAKYCLLDDWDIALYNHPNNHEAFAYAKNLNKKLLEEKKPGLDMNLHKLDYTFKFGIVKDNKVQSEEFYNNLRTGFINSYKLKFKNTYNEQDLEELAEKEADKSLREYKNMNEADGFGFVTFDWYRILSKLTDDWGDQQEKIYMQIINGEVVSQGMLAITFPVKKFLYNGVTFLKKGDIPADTTHKYALAPLIPGSGDNNLKTKHENLVKEGKVYEIFYSASKRETISKNISTKGISDTFYDGDPRERIILPLEANAEGKYESGKTALYGMTMLLKEQVHVDTEIKSKSILARQLKRIIKTDLYNEGVPMDFQTDLKKDGVDNFVDIKREWNSLTEEEKREKSKTHSIYRGVMDSIKKINIKELDGILDKLGVQIVKDKKGKITYEVKDEKKILNLLSKELEKRTRQQKTGSSTIYSNLLRVQALAGDAEIEAFDNINTFKSIIKSIIDKDIRLRKYNGSNLVQAPVTGNEPIEIGKRNILIDANSYLRFYRSTETGTLKAEVMITFDDRWKHLLKLTYKNRVIGNLDTLNEALLDEEWRAENETKISLLAVRVPIQDPNSIEAFVIKQFLPKSAGSKIVVPTEIVAKAGSDFDIDKLIVYYFNPDPKTGVISFDENTTEGLENLVIKGYIDLLLLPEMFYKLVSANNITALKKSPGSTGPDMIIDYLEENGEKSLSNPDRTTLRSPSFNLGQKTNLNSGKYLLGHGANTRSYFEELKHADFVTSLTARFKVSRYLTAQDESTNQAKKFNIVVEPLTGKDVTAPIRFPFISNEGDLLYNTSEIVNEKGQKEGNAISLSNIFNKNKMQISEIISATMNGFVDIEKDDWITRMKMNEYLTGIDYMFTMAGTPIETVGLFNNQKVIQDFVLSKLSLEQSPYKKLFNENKSSTNTRIMMDIINDMLSSMRTRVDEFGNAVESNEEYSEQDYRYELSEEAKNRVIEALSMAGIESDELINYITLYNYRKEDADARQRAKIVLNVELENIFFNNFKTLTEDKFLTNEQLEAGLNVPYNKMSVGVLSHQFKLLSFFPFLLEYSSKLGNLMAAEDYDKATSQNIADEYSNQSTIRSIKSGGYFPKEAVKRFESLNVSADYNISKMTIEVAQSIFKLTENKKINRYAIRLAGILYRYIKKDKNDSFINGFKADFINFVVQNYGSIPVKDAEGNVKDRNIVEYLVNESVFVDKDTREGLTPSYQIDRVSLATKLFSILENFKLFSSLEALNYLKVHRVRKKESEEDEPDSFIYQLGRMFRNLSPIELTNYNKDTEAFAKLEIKVKDALDSIEKSKEDIFNIFNIDLTEGNKVITIEEVIQHLNSLKPADDSSYSEIKEKKINPEILNVINKLVEKSNEVKTFVATALPYLSILQTTSSYSTNYLSNLFVKKNYEITKRAIKNFNKKEPEGVTNELLDNYVVQFLLNNMDSYIKNDKKGEILKAISGALIDERSGDLEFIDYKYSNIINNSNYFNNYHMKNFDVFAEELDFENEEFIKEIVMANRIEEKTKTRVFDFNIIFDREKKDKEKEDSDNEGDDDIIDLGVNLIDEGKDDTDPDDLKVGTVTIEKGTYLIASKDDVFDLNKNKVTDPIIKNMVLVNYANKLKTLKTVDYKNNTHFVVGDKIINSNFEEIDMSQKPLELVDLLIAATPHQFNC